MWVSGVAALVISEVDSLVIGGASRCAPRYLLAWCQFRQPALVRRHQCSGAGLRTLKPTSTGAPVRKALSGSSSGSSGCGS